ncbi:hypothetical protein CSHISOI_04973 [Colletotrichum shisoi]|uniref:Uncharacterized protein n=1 Tax=Colletotrichum shisoi TaxID=2078593 RepID=A0A5Q4BV86_9PEZI|nr:hypothetical protein CSHISOI_04973 [Colletotrichum shisoi]
MFSATELLRWSEEDSGIRTVLSCIGNVYASRGLQLATIQTGDVLLMEVEQREIYDTIQKRLQQPSPHLDKSLLHLAVFFCLLQAHDEQSGTQDHHEGFGSAQSAT